jgi:hypothetical protein
MTQILQPPSIALEGPSGTGKTDCIATFADAGVEVFHLGTEPGACEVLVDSFKRRGLPLSKLHFHQMELAPLGWSALRTQIEMVREMTFEALTGVKDIAKREMKHFMEMASFCNNFIDDKDGRSYGDMMEWDSSRVFVLDSLSGINKMAREYVVGYRPHMHVGEWGVAMQLEENFIYSLIAKRKCFFVVIAHVDREVDDVFGGTKLTLSALGRKLAPQLVKFFSEVIYTKREGRDFLWSTQEPNVDTKFRSLPNSPKIPPTFQPIVEAYRQRIASLASVSEMPIPAAIAPAAG